MIVCKECGHENHEGDAFCGSCATFLEWTGERITEEPIGEVKQAEGGEVEPGTLLVAPADGASEAADGAPVDDAATATEQPAAVKPAVERPRPAPKGPKEAPRPIRPDDLICGACGEGNDKSRKFCRRCGNSLVASPAVAPAASRPTGEPRLPWWKRLLASVRGAGGAGRGGGRSALGALSKSRRYLRPALAVVAVGALLGVVGPGRGTVQGWFRSAKRAVSPEFERIQPNGVAATSEVPEHEGAKAIDGVSDSFWSEGAPGNGEGAMITVFFAEPTKLAKIGFLSGASESPEEFIAQPRAADLQLEFLPSGNTQKIRLKDERDFQTFNLKGAGEVTEVRITIVSTHASLGGTDSSISEIELFTKR